MNTPVTRLTLPDDPQVRRGTDAGPAGVLSGPAALRDQSWLDDRIADIDDGIEAVLDIARNWTTGRNVARLHPGVSAADYVTAHVQHALGKGIVVPLLEQSDWSNRQIAEVAGVSEPTVRRTASSDAVDVPDRPDRTLGADGKYRPARVIREVKAEVIEPVEEEPPIAPDLWPDLARVMDAIEVLSKSDASVFAAGVPDHRRAATAKRLRKLGTYLGRIAWTLEQSEERP